MSEKVARPANRGGLCRPLPPTRPVSTPSTENQACLKWSGETLLLDGPCVIGRRSDNDLQINNVQASRRHALVIRVNDDWWLNDLGSRNGVQVNGVRLSAARRLRDGDEIRIANQSITFRHSSQGPIHRSTIAGGTTQFAVSNGDAPTPSAVSCDLIVATETGAILEGDKVGYWYFGKALERAPGAEHYHLPAGVCQWLERATTAEENGSASLELEEKGRRVIISLARHKAGRCFLLVREESFTASMEKIQTLGLTEREAEVMHWICLGKTNQDIAKILDVTVHTVNRHVEHIFKKFGVDNRQKAVLTVQERLTA